MNALEDLVEGKELDEKQAMHFMKDLMSGNIEAAVAGAYLTALRIRGETPREIAAFAKVMRENAIQVKPNVKNLVDLCGTGGDSKNTFNISTTAMFVVAGAGAYVAKHGNRSITSNCGSADVLEALGAKLELKPREIARCIEKTHVGFMFAPHHHPAMKHVMPIRKAMGIRTVFNVLGPLTNPANAQGQLIGVFNPKLTEQLARVCQLLGLERAMIVHGNPGLDELSTLGYNQVSILKDDEIKTDSLDPRKLGFKQAELPDIESTGCEQNVEIIHEILDGVKGARRDIVVLNAAGALISAGICDGFESAIPKAEDSIDSGNAEKVLKEFIEFTEKK